MSLGIPGPGAKAVPALRLPIGGGGSPLSGKAAIAGGSLWVAAGGVGTHRVLRIDPRANTVAATIPIDTGVHAVASGAGAVWATRSLFSGSRLYRIDPAADRVVATLDLDAGVTDVAVGDAAVWVANSTTGVVHRVDPATSRVTTEIPVGKGRISLEMHAGRLWVVDSGNRTVSRFDGATGSRIGAPTVIGGFLRGFAVGEGGVWVLQRDQTSVLHRIDPGTGKVEASIPLGSAAADFVAVGGGFVFVSSSRPRSGASDIQQIEPRTGRIVLTFSTGSGSGHPMELLVGERTLWFYHRTLWRLDLDDPALRALPVG